VKSRHPAKVMVGKSNSLSSFLRCVICVIIPFPSWTRPGWGWGMLWQVKHETLGKVAEFCYWLKMNVLRRAKRSKRSVSIGLQEGIDFHMVLLEAGADVIEGIIHIVGKFQ